MRAGRTDPLDRRWTATLRSDGKSSRSTSSLLAKIGRHLSLDARPIGTDLSGIAAIQAAFDQGCNPTQFCSCDPQPARNRAIPVHRRGNRLTAHDGLMQIFQRADRIDTIAAQAVSGFSRYCHGASKACRRREVQSGRRRRACYIVAQNRPCDGLESVMPKPPEAVVALLLGGGDDHQFAGR